MDRHQRRRERRRECRDLRHDLRRQDLQHRSLIQHLILQGACSLSNSSRPPVPQENHPPPRSSSPNQEMTVPVRMSLSGELHPPQPGTSQQNLFQLPERGPTRDSAESSHSPHRQRSSTHRRQHRRRHHRRHHHRRHHHRRPRHRSPSQDVVLGSPGDLDLTSTE